MVKTKIDGVEGVFLSFFSRPEKDGTRDRRINVNPVRPQKAYFG
jgi:hypothetical protein